MSIVLTGATAGLGLTLLNRLVDQEPTRHYIVIARDLAKARRNFVQIEARLKLNGGKLDIVYGDHAKMGTLFAAADEVKLKTEEIDALFLNAGTMGKCSLNYLRQAMAFLTFRVFAALTCDATLNVDFQPQTTEDGYEFRFQTNCLSHYVLVKQLGGLLKKSGIVIWTSSSAGQRRAYSPDDIQCTTGTDPYGSSKWAVNMASIITSRSMNIKSTLADPGTFATAGITGQLTPLFLFFIFSYFFALLRPFIPELCLTTDNASESLMHIYNNRDSIPAAHGGQKVTLFRSFTTELF